MLDQHETCSQDRDLHIPRINRNPRGRPFGALGHVGGRPPGARNKATLLAEALLESETDAVLHSLVAQAKAGHAAAVRVVGRFMVPNRRHAPRFHLRPIRTEADALAAAHDLLQQMAAGEIDPWQAERIQIVIDRHLQMLCTVANHVKSRAANRSETRESVRYGSFDVIAAIEAEVTPVADEPPLEEVAPREDPRGADEAATSSLPGDAAPESAAAVPPQSAPYAVELPSWYMATPEGVRRAREELGMGEESNAWPVEQNDEIAAPRLVRIGAKRRRARA